MQKAPKADLQRTLAEQLESVPDLLKELQATKPDGQRLLGFAALSGSDDEIQALARDKRAAKGCDLLMANPIDRNGQGFGAAMNGGGSSKPMALRKRCLSWTSSL